MNQQICLNFETKCNQKCFFCNRDSTEPALTTLQVKDKLKNLSNQNVENILLSGGEPTIREDLLGLIEFISNKKIQVTLLTNGVKLADKEYCKNLINAGLNEALVSLHSHKEKVSDFLTQAPGTFKKTIKAIHNLQDLKFPVFISHVLCSTNHKEAVDFCKWLKKEFSNPPKIQTSFVMPAASALNNTWIIPKMSEVEPYLMQMIKYCIMENIDFLISDCGLPLCYLIGYEKYVPEIEKMTNPNNHIDIILRGKTSYKQRITKNKKKGAQCKMCSKNEICSGIWKNYAKIYGCSELRPIKQQVKLDHSFMQIP